MKKKIEYEVGSGNVFADIGRPGAGEHLIKAHLVFKIGRIILGALGQDVEIVVEPHTDTCEAARLVPPRPAIYREKARAAAADIRAMSKGVTLGGLKIKELVAEGRL